MSHTYKVKHHPTFTRQQMYDYIIQSDSDISLIVGRLLTSLGFKSKLCGTLYLHAAIMYCYNTNNRVGIAGNAYRSVAELYDTTFSRVERSIRTAISICYFHGELSAFNILAQAPIVEAKSPPTNSEFMCSVVNWLQLEKQAGNIKDRDQM